MLAVFPLVAWRTMTCDRATMAPRAQALFAWCRQAVFAGGMLVMATVDGNSSSLPKADGWCSVAVSKTADQTQALVEHLAPLLDSQPQPLSHLYLAKHLPHQGRHDESVEGVHQLEHMRDAALAWRAGAGDNYAEMAKRYLLAWAATYQPTLQPIDETNFDSLVQTYAILKMQIAAEDRLRIGAWLGDWAEAYVQNMRGASERGNHAVGWSNNWQSHRIKLVTMIAAALDDAHLFEEARSLFKAQLMENIGADGEVLDFSQRDALHYVVYDLEPLLRAALAARSRGEDWYDDGLVEGRSLKRAVAWLVPYVAGDKTHEEFVHSSVPFDRERAEAGLKGFSGEFDPRYAAELFWVAAEFEPRYRDVAERLDPSEPSFVAVCGQ